MRFLNTVFATLLLINMVSSSLAQGGKVAIKKSIKAQSVENYGRPTVEEGLRMQRNDENALKLHPELLHPLATANKARDTGNLPEAIRLYQTRTSGSLDYCEAQSNLARIYAWQGKLTQSLQAYRNLMPTATSRNSWGSDPKTLYGYSSVLARAGRWEEAVRLFEHTQARHNDTNSKSADKVPMVHFNSNIFETNKLVAWTDYLLGRNVYPNPGYRRDEELRHLRRAVKLQPTFYEVHAILGMALIGKDAKSEEGRAHLEIAAKHTTDPALKEKYSFWAGTPLPGKVYVLGRGKDGKDFAHEVPRKTSP